MDQQSTTNPPTLPLNPELENIELLVFKNLQETINPDKPPDPIPPNDRSSPSKSTPDSEIPDFNWDNEDDDDVHDEDDDEEGGVRYSCCYSCWKWYRRWPILLRTILYCLSGNVIFMIPGAISYLFYIEDTSIPFTKWNAKSGFEIASYPIFLFSVYLCIIWTAWFGLKWALSVIPDIILRLIDSLVGTTTDLLTGMQLRSSRIEHLINYIKFLKGYVCFVLWCVVSLFTWTMIFSEHWDKNLRYPWEKVVQLIWLNLMFAGLIWTIEKFFLQIFSVQFHRRAYLERMNQSREAMSVLEHLNRSRRVIFSTSTQPGASTSNTSSVPIPKKAHLAAKRAKHFGQEIIGGFSSVLSLAVGYDAKSHWFNSKTGIVLRNTHDAKFLAKTLFEAIINHRRETVVGSGLPKTALFPQDFTKWFDSPEEAKRAFAVFDKDGNGDITQREMKSTVLQIFLERKSLETSLRDTDQAIQKMDDLLKVFVYVILLFVTLGIWDVDTKSFLTAAISIWAGILFAVGGTVKNLLENIIFLFITHPYDVGDRVDIDSERYTVKEFGMLTTILRTLNGREIYGPNNILSKKFIHNIRRSGPQSEEVLVRVVSTTPLEKIVALQDRIRKFLATEQMRREFIGAETFTVSIKEIVDANTLVLSMALEHKNNWQDGKKKVLRKNEFMIELKEILEDLDFELCNGQLKVTLTNSTGSVPLGFRSL
ncbi:hypothetical protein HK098_007551 [Nowakowskiella sp. JEL0407]|nr:hypothetical protein HK098_007551 [Nowakowskiella sp. JEL0407]